MSIKRFEISSPLPPPTSILNFFRSFQLKEVGVIHSTLYWALNFPILFCTLSTTEEIGDILFQPVLLMLHYVLLLFWLSSSIKDQKTSLLPEVDLSLLPSFFSHRERPMLAGNQKTKPIKNENYTIINTGPRINTGLKIINAGSTRSSFWWSRKYYYSESNQIYVPDWVSPDQVYTRFVSLCDSIFKNRGSRQSLKLASPNNCLKMAKFQNSVKICQDWLFQIEHSIQFHQSVNNNTPLT